MRSATLLVAAIALVLCMAVPTNAGSIGFTITTTVEHAHSLRADVSVTNNGDEPAFAVVPTITFGTVSVAAERKQRIQPGATESWKLSVLESVPSNGTYALLVRLRYEDANAYPFEVIAPASFTIGDMRKKPVFGSIVVPSVRAQEAASGAVSLHVPPERKGPFAVSLAVPSGLKISPLEHTIDVSTNRKIRVPIEIRNVTLLAGTQVNVFALVTSLSDTPPHTDVVRGTVRIQNSPEALSSSTFVALAAVAVVIFVLLEVISGTSARPETLAVPDGTFLTSIVEVAICSTVVGFLLLQYPWSDLLADTTPAGGDMASLYYPTTLLANEILPSGKVTGWTMGNYAGFAIFHFYSTLPFVLIVALGKLIPMTIAFKLVSLLGPTCLPFAAAYLFRTLGYRCGGPAIAAASVLPFLFQQGNSMWGGNIPSVLAGEFCHAIGITLSILYLGVLHQTASGERRWPTIAILLAVIGLCHTFAFLAAAWYSLFFLWPRANQQEAASRVLTGILVAVLLLAFWALPLPGRLVFTTEWSMIWRIGGWKEVLPPPLWPAGVLAGTSIIASLLRVKPFHRDRQGVMLFAFAGGFLLYLLVPAVGFPDIRFIPIAQLFLGFLAADFLHWLGSASRHGLALAACIVGGGLLWGQENLGYIPSWLRWNYSGYERKTTWPTFKEINEHLRGDINSPRVVFEHSQAHNRFGSSRAFENLPLFSGRSTLEGVFHQASLSSPFVFYLQSEASERGSGPFPQHTYTRLNPNKALPHLRLFNVDRIVVVSDAAKSAYEANQSYTKTFESGSYSVFSIDGGNTGYAVAAANQPVLYDGPKWKLAFYRWYKHADLLDLPLVPRELLTESQADAFELRTDTVRRIPRVPYDGACNVRSHLEQYRITIDTDCPGRPHIVKVSYFPRWHTDDGSPVYPVAPSFMLVTPRGGHIELLYRHNSIDWLAIGLTLVGLLTVAGSLASGRVSAIVVTPVNRLLWSVFQLPDRFVRGLSLVLLMAALGAAALTRAHLRAPEILYEEAQESYRGRHFDEAASRLQRWTATDKDTFKQATALYQLGISYTELGDYSAAVQTHERLRFEFPNVDYGAGTLFHLARNHAAVHDLVAAREYAALLSTEFPDSTWVQRLNRENPELTTQ